MKKKQTHSQNIQMRPNNLPFMGYHPSDPMFNRQMPMMPPSQNMPLNINPNIIPGMIPNMGPNMMPNMGGNMGGNMGNFGMPQHNPNMMINRGMQPKASSRTN